MTSYVLVSLWAPDDSATIRSHDFAVRLHQRRRAAAFLEGEAPSTQEVHKAALAAPEAAVVFFAHGGAALSARQGGAAWIQATELAKLLPGRRIYAFACSTFAPNRALLGNTFANNAVTACIAVFAGHRAPVMSPPLTEGDKSEQMTEALFGMIGLFIDGENDESALRSHGRRFANWNLPIELDLPSEDPQQEGAFGWSSTAFLGGFFNSLCVFRKPDEVGEPASQHVAD